MRFIKDIRKYIILSGIAFLLIISLFTAATVLIHKPGVQQYLLKKVCIGYGLETRTGEMELDIFGASGVVIHDVETCRTDKSCRVTASSIAINFSKLRFLMGQLVPVSVDIKHPVIIVSETSAKSLFIKKEGEGKGTLRMPILCRDGVNRFNIEDGEVLVDGPSGFSVKNISATLEHVEKTSASYKISGTGRVEYKKDQSVINIKSTVDVNPDNILKSVFSASLKTENTPLVWIPESSKYIDFTKGHVSADLNITGNPLDGIRLGGPLKCISSGFILFHKDQSKSYDIPEVNGVINASYKDKVIKIDSLDVKSRDLNGYLDMALDLNDFHNPYFRLTAKTQFMPAEAFIRYFPSQITEPWLEEKLFPMFEDGTVRMDKLVLDGTIDQFRHIRDRENHSILGIYLTCKSFTVSNMGIQIPVTGVSASVDISDGNLNISGLGGVFGDSEINEWSLDVDGMIGGKPVFKVYVDGDFDIQELMSHRGLYVLPEKARQRIEKYSGLDGRLSARTTIGYRKGWDAPRILSGDYSFRDTLYHKRYLDLPLRFSQIDFHFPGKGENTFSGKGLFGNTPFSVTGITELSGSTVLIKHAGITADADINQLVRKGLKSDESFCKFRESLPMDITIDKQGESFAYSGSADLEKLVMEWKNIIFHAAGTGNSATFNLLQDASGKLEMNDILVRLGKSGISLSGEYSLPDERLNTLKITSSDLSIGDLGIEIKETDNTLSGNLKGTLNFDFSGGALNKMQINGNLSGDRISFIPGFLPLPVSECSFSLDLSGKKGFINQLDMKFGEHPLHIKGILHGWESIKGDLLATADYIDLTELIAPSKKTSATDKTLFKSPEIDLKLNASRGIWQKIEFKRLITEINISEKSIAVKNAQAELETGDVSVNGTIGRNGSGKIDIHSRINLVNQPIDKIISDAGFGDKGIKGTLSLKTSLNIEGNANESILKNLSGKIDSMRVTKGLIKNSRVFLKILDGLNIPDKFRQRPADMREEGFYFHSIEGTGLIEKGILRTDEFVIKSPVFNAVGSGKENLYKQTHNIRLLVQPLTNLDYIIHKIPLVGPIIASDNETVFTVGYDVHGPWDKPNLDYAPSENLKGLGGVLKRAILTPARIIENIAHAAKSMKKPDPEVIDSDKSSEKGASTEAEKP